MLTGHDHVEMACILLMQQSTHLPHIAWRQTRAHLEQIFPSVHLSLPDSHRHANHRCNEQRCTRRSHLAAIFDDLHRSCLLSAMLSYQAANAPTEHLPRSRTPTLPAICHIHTTGGGVCSERGVMGAVVYAQQHLMWELGH